MKEGQGLGALTELAASERSLAQPALKHVVTFRGYLMLGVGSMIGIGWVIVLGDWLNRGGPLGAILAFVIGGTLLLAVGHSYAELTAAMPVAGAELAFAYKAFGTRTSFLTAWLIAFDYTAVCAFETVAAGWLLEHMFPALQTTPLYTLGGYPVRLPSIVLGVAIGLVVIFLNDRGVEASTAFQTSATYLKLFCCAVFVAFALFNGSLRHMTPLFAEGGDLGSAIRSVVAVMAIVGYFLAGFDIVPTAAEEASIPPKDLGKAIVFSILVGIVFYSLVILAVAVSMPWKEAARLEMPTATVFRVALGAKWAADLVMFAAFLGLVTSLNGAFLAASRILFSCGRGGLLPRWFERVHETHRTPRNAIVFVGVVTVLGPFLGRLVLLPIVNVGALAFMSAVLVSCLAAVRLRRTAPDMPRPYRVRSVLTLYLGVAVAASLVLLLVVPGSPGRLKWPSEFALFAVWLALGWVAHEWRRKREDLVEERRASLILGPKR